MKQTLVAIVAISLAILLPVAHCSDIKLQLSRSGSTEPEAMVFGQYATTAHDAVQWLIAHALDVPAYRVLVQLDSSVNPSSTAFGAEISFRLRTLREFEEGAPSGESLAAAFLKLAVEKSPKRRYAAYIAPMGVTDAALQDKLGNVLGVEDASSAATDRLAWEEDQSADLFVHAPEEVSMEWHVAQLRHQFAVLSTNGTNGTNGTDVNVTTPPPIMTEVPGTPEPPVNYDIGEEEEEGAGMWYGIIFGIIAFLIIVTVVVGCLKWYNNREKGPEKSRKYGSRL